MNNRLRLVSVLGILILFGMTMTACNRERPALTTGTGTPAGRATVTGPTAVAPVTTQVAAPTAVGGGASTVATPSAPATRSAVAASPTPVAARASGETFTYTVEAGDTLLDIAVRFGTTTEALVQLNSLPDPNALIRGQKLIIPGTKETAGSATSGGATTTGSSTTYTVQQGDTLGSIAQRFGTTVRELVALNKLTDADSIGIGQVLKLQQRRDGSGGANRGRTQDVRDSTRGYVAFNCPRVWVDRQAAYRGQQHQGSRSYFPGADPGDSLSKIRSGPINVT